jgi:hypothetical protein
MIDRMSVANPETSVAADITVYGEDGWPVADVEIKNPIEMTSETASAIRRNLSSYGLVREQTPYFLIISQDTGFLWRQAAPGQADDPPLVEFAMSPVVAHYLRWFSPEDRLSGNSLGFVVAGWLLDLSTRTGPMFAAAASTFAGTGFLEAIEGGKVRINDRE